MTDQTTLGAAPDPGRTNAGAGGHPSHRPHTRTTDPREETRPRALRIGLALVILAAAGAVDTPLAKATFDLALRLPEAVSWLVAIGVTAIAVAGAWKAGASLHRGRLGEAIGAACVPLTVALGLFVLRWNAHAFSNATAAWEGSGSESTVDMAAEQILAWVMLLLFIATAVLAFFDGLHLTDDAGARVRSTHARLEKTDAREAVEHGRVVRLTEETAKAVHVLRRTSVDERVALRALDARCDELKAWARLEVARLLGDPVATSAVIMAQRASDAQHDEDAHDDTQRDEPSAADETGTTVEEEN